MYNEDLCVRSLHRFPDQPITIVADGLKVKDKDQAQYHAIIEKLLDRAWAFGLARKDIVEIEVIVPREGEDEEVTFTVESYTEDSAKTINVHKTVNVTVKRLGVIHLRQKVNHDPDNDQWGDCHRTAIAMVLGLNVLSVPAPNAQTMATPEAFNDLYNKWYKDNGYAAFSIGISASSVEEALQICNGFANSHGQNLPYILGGASARGCNHSVAVINGIVYDPHPSDKGLVGPLISSDDHYHMTVILKPSRP